MWILRWGRVSLGCLVAAPLAAQRVEVAASGAAVTNSEITSAHQARGLGLTGSVGFTSGRFHLEARALTASLQADFSLQPDYALHQFDLNLTYRWRPLLGFQLGAGRRFVDPDFAAQEVGLVRVGVITRHV